jgi:hypothetical protein
MDDELAETKRRISQKYLGKAGIFGVGLRGQTIAVYRNAAAGDPSAVIADLEKEGSPFKIEVLEGESATIQGAVGAGKDR